MFNEIPIANLKVGMKFSESLYFDEGNNIFVPANTPISEKDMEVLQQWKIKNVFSKTTDFSTENNDNINSTIQNSKNNVVSVKSEKIKETYNELVSELHKIFEKLKQRQVIQDKPVSKIIEKLTESAEKDPCLFVELILNSDIENYKMAKAAINTAILSYIIAKHLELFESEIEDIVTAAILHDIGMLRVNDDIIQKNKALTDMEMQTVEAHTNYGFKCAVSELMYTEAVGKIIMQHHEHWDGTGYPGKLTAKQITLGARILAVADSFVAMTSPKAYRDAMLGYDAMKNLLNDNGEHFDPEVIKATIQSLGIFPIGSIVLLNNTAICMVIKNEPKTPLRPNLQVIIDEHGQEFENQTGELIDLSIQKNLFILRAINPKEYKKISI